jgi:hypothetical protein
VHDRIYPKIKGVGHDFKYNLTAAMPCCNTSKGTSSIGFPSRYTTLSRLSLFNIPFKPGIRQPHFGAGDRCFRTDNTLVLAAKDWLAWFFQILPHSL